MVMGTAVTLGSRPRSVGAHLLVAKQGASRPRAGARWPLRGEWLLLVSTRVDLANPRLGVVILDHVVVKERVEDPAQHAESCPALRRDDPRSAFLDTACDRRR
jgi:hypothetical protein